MQATPLFLGACALVSIAGMVSGTSINTNPIQRGGIGMNEITRPVIDIDAPLRDQPSLPDHYAMKTPEGNVEVGELTTRGLYAQRRFGWREAAWNPPPLPDYSVEDYSSDNSLPEPVRVDAQEAANAAVQVADAAHYSVEEEPTPIGEARLIDVDQTLAGG